MPFLGVSSSFAKYPLGLPSRVVIINLAFSGVCRAQGNDAALAVLWCVDDGRHSTIQLSQYHEARLAGVSTWTRILAPQQWLSDATYGPGSAMRPQATRSP